MSRTAGLITVIPIWTGNTTASPASHFSQPGYRAAQWGPGKLNPYAGFLGLRPDAQPGHIVFVYHGTFSVPLLAAYSLSAEAAQLAAKGKWAEAIAKSEAAVQLAPDSAEIQADLGSILMKAGRMQEGRHINEIALRIAESSYPEFQGRLIQRLKQPGMTAPAAR